MKINYRNLHSVFFVPLLGMSLGLLPDTIWTSIFAIRITGISDCDMRVVESEVMHDLAEERVEIPILLDGRFVLEGTLKLNEAFEG